MEEAGQGAVLKEGKGSYILALPVLHVEVPNPIHALILDEPSGEVVYEVLILIALVNDELHSIILRAYVQQLTCEGILDDRELIQLPHGVSEAVAQVPHECVNPSGDQILHFAGHRVLVGAVIVV